MLPLKPPIPSPARFYQGKSGDAGHTPLRADEAYTDNLLYILK